MTPDRCNILVRCHTVSLRRNRRASDYLQDCQRDGQTYAASEVFLERRFASSWIVVRIFNLQSHDASDIEQTSISTNKDGERCLINQCISRGPGLLLPYQTQACRWQTGGQVVLFQPALWSQRVICGEVCEFPFTIELLSQFASCYRMFC